MNSGIKKPDCVWIIRVANDDFPNRGLWTYQEANWACEILGKPHRYNKDSKVDLQFYVDMQKACRKYLKENNHVD